MKEHVSLFGRFLDTALEAIDYSKVPEDKVADVVSDLLETSPSELLALLKKEAPKMLEVERKARVDFGHNNYARWREPLDLLEMLWKMSQELGENHAHGGPRDGDTVVFDTLAHLQPKALLVASEIMCLLRGGFADGALTRWRSLHEIVVVAMFIAKHGYKAAFPYRLSVWFSNSRRAANYNKYAGRSGLRPIGAEELAEIQAMRNTAEQELGRVLKNDWDWAADTLGNKQPSFTDIENDVGMDHWRPRFKWACQHVHAGFVLPNKLLGMTEAKKFVFQVGSSNSGLVDPIHMTAISLMQMTITSLFFPDSDFDRVVYGKVMQALVGEIGDAAMTVKSGTLGGVEKGHS